MNNLKLISLKNLYVWYSKDKPILSNFSVDLGTNEIVGLIGLNGAGKTTFIKTISGLINSYRVETADYHGKSFSFLDTVFKQNRYTVFAEDHSFQYFTFREYLSYVAASYKKNLADISSLVEGFHFNEYTDILLKELSTGNLKKAYLITAFALCPELLLLDEPVNGLDFQSTEYLYQLMEEYKEHGTILFSSHILESICLTSDRVIVIEQGQMKQSFAGKDIEAAHIREVLSNHENS